jgi:hypothetical protein
MKDVALEVVGRLLSAASAVKEARYDLDHGLKQRIVNGVARIAIIQIEDRRRIHRS